MKTYWYYKNAHLIDQSMSVRACGVRQRHIDQAQSMNLYITNDYTLRQVLSLYILACECGVKTIYYITVSYTHLDVYKRQTFTTFCPLTVSSIYPFSVPSAACWAL